GPAGARDLQWIPDPLRSAPAAGCAHPQRGTALHRPGCAAARRDHRDTVDPQRHGGPVSPVAGEPGSPVTEPAVSPVAGEPGRRVTEPAVSPADTVAH